MSEKRRIVEETLESGASVARVAQRHGVNPNVVFHWRREYREGKLAEPGLVPVAVVEEQPVSRPAESRPSPGIRIELPGGAVIHVEGGADPALIEAVVRGLRA